MRYGVPPYEAFIEHDGGDLGRHGIFETYFYEFQFKFDSSKFITSKINVQDGTTSSGKLFLRQFLFYIDNLNSEYQLHFDLYSTKLKYGDYDINKFAPF